MSAISQSASLLAHRPFLFFWLARVGATIAMQMQAVAVGWQMYSITGSALDLGLVGLAQFLPVMLLFLLTGHVADRYDRRMVLRICQTVEALAVAVLAWGTFGGWITREVILATSVVIGAARAFEAPALSSLLPTIVSVDLFPRAVAGSASANQFATIAGPALGGLVYAANPVAAYAVSSILFLIASILIAFVSVLIALKRRDRFQIASLFAGFSFIRRQPIVLGAISLDLFAVLLGGATALLPIFARDVLATDAWGLGLLRASPALGALATSIILARWPLRTNVGRVMYACVAVFGIATIVFAVSHSLVLSMAALAVLGAADLISVVIRMTLVQLETPDEMRGRVSAVNALFIGTSNQLGEFRAGVMAAFIGAVPAVLVGGVGTLLIVVAWIRLFPQLFHVDQMQATEPSRT
ncbi:MAG TPA: MFS transporter [Xanthobacteraceae bacterium]|nr:MFS transporter [Xanthobacteraceae bacterium]